MLLPKTAPSLGISFLLWNVMLLLVFLLLLFFLKTLGEEVLMKYAKCVSLEELELLHYSPSHKGAWGLASWPARRCVFLCVLFFFFFSKIVLALYFCDPSVLTEKQCLFFFFSFSVNGYKKCPVAVSATQRICFSVSRGLWLLWKLVGFHSEFGTACSQIWLGDLAAFSSPYASLTWLEME